MDQPYSIKKELDQMDFQTFEHWKSEFKTKNPSWSDRSETRLYRSLKQAQPTEWPDLVASMEEKAQYRCHIGELWLNRWGLPWSNKPCIKIGRGVRHALKACLSLANERHLKVGVPSDVYPFYQDIAQQEGVEVIYYEASRGLPSLDILDSMDWLLICDPLKPWGKELSTEDEKRLTEWLKKTGRLVWIDSVYQPDLNFRWITYWREQKAVVMTSLSKGWLEPGVCGATLVPESLKEDFGRHLELWEPKDESSLRKAWSALTEKADRPLKVKAALMTWARDLAGTGEWAPGSYFFYSEKKASEWLKEGVIVLPVSVFGSHRSGSIVSCLPAIQPLEFERK